MTGFQRLGPIERVTAELTDYFRFHRWIVLRNERRERQEARLEASIRFANGFPSKHRARWTNCEYQHVRRWLRIRKFGSYSNYLVHAHKVRG